MDDIVVGVTSVGGGVGQSIVDSCLLSNLPLRLVGFDTSPFAFAAYDCATYVYLPRIGHSDYLDVLLRMCQRYGVQVLIPGLDLETLPLSQARDRFRAAGVVLLSGGEPFIRLCRDKLRWSRELGAISESIVRGFSPSEAREAVTAGTFPFPSIAKPIDGSASSGVVLIQEPIDVEHVTANHTVQPLLLPHSRDPNRKVFLAGLASGRIEQVSEVSYQMVVGKSGDLLGDMATRNRLKAGVPVEIVPIDPAPWREAAAPLLPHLQMLGMSGPVNFQGRLTDDGIRFFEMNGRFTGITGLRAILGFNEVELLVRDALDLPVDGIAFTASRRRIGLRQIKDRSVDVARNEELYAAVAGIEGRPAEDSPLTVMLTGATGWLGRHLLAALLRSPRVAEVICVARRADALSLQNREAGKLTMLSLDDADAYGFGLGHVDIVYHLAGARPPQGNRAIAESLSFTRRLLDEAARFHVPSLINVSSQAVYGRNPVPWSETDNAAPETIYAMGKFSGEEFVKVVQRVSPGSRMTSVRLARLYGSAAGLRWDELPHKFARQAATGEEIVVYSSDQHYDLIHIEDAVTALLSFLKEGERWQGTYNLGSGQSYAIADIAGAAVAAARLRGRTCPDFRVVAAATEGDVGRTRMTIDRFKRDFDWRPTVDLAVGMAGVVDRSISELEVKNG